MYLNPNYNRTPIAIKEPEDYNYEGNIFLTKTYKEFVEEQNLKSNYDKAVKKAGLESLLKNFKVSKSDSRPVRKNDCEDIKNYDQRLYKVGMGDFVETRESAETKEIDFTDSELLKVYIDNKSSSENSEDTTLVEDSELQRLMDN